LWPVQVYMLYKTYHWQIYYWVQIAHRRIIFIYRLSSINTFHTSEFKKMEKYTTTEVYRSSKCQFGNSAQLSGLDIHLLQKQTVQIQMCYYRAKQLLSPASAGFLLGLLFDPEHGGNIGALSKLHDVTIKETYYSTLHKVTKCFCLIN
jgi:hypothetical protein